MTIPENLPSWAKILLVDPLFNDEPATAQTLPGSGAEERSASLSARNEGNGRCSACTLAEVSS